jgi:hypothetical protein
MQRVAVPTGNPSKSGEQWDSGSLPRLQNSAVDHRSRSRTPRRPSVSTGASSASPHNSERGRQSMYVAGIHGGILIWLR